MIGITRVLMTFLVVGGFAGVVAGCASPTDATDDPTDDPTDENDLTSAQAFVCGQPQERAKDSAPYGQVMKVRAAGHGTFDRFVIEFKHQRGLPNYRITPKNNAKFTGPGEGPSSQFNLEGTRGLNVLLPSASGFDGSTGLQTFTGEPRFKVGDGKSLLEAAQVEDFEGYVQWGLGLKDASCYRVYGLSSPARLVVDIKKAASN